MSEQKITKALLLIGGFGTRLRPLTFSKAKPLIEFVNKPILVHQIEALKKVGVCEIVLAINYNCEKMLPTLQEFEKKYDLKITISKEEYPLGTAGPIGLAKKYLEDADQIFVFNADITCKFPLQEMLDYHRKHGKEGTIGVTKVKDPSRFGVIVTDSNKKILQFVEKPQIYVGNDINSGLYIFNKKFLNRVEPKPTSIEREVFPKMAADQELYAFDIEGFWADIGKPCDYILGTQLYLENLNNNSSEILSKLSEGIEGNVVIGSNTTIEEGCLIGPNTVIGDNCIIKKGTRIKNSVVFSGSQISEYSYIEGSIIGWNCKIGKWCRVSNLSVLGEDVTLRNELILNKNIIMPNVTIKNTPKESEILLA